MSVPEKYDCPVCGAPMGCKRMNRRPGKPPGFFGLCVVQGSHSCKVMAYELEPGESVPADLAALEKSLTAAEKNKRR